MRQPGDKPHPVDQCQCGSRKTRILDSRNAGNHRTRRRVCDVCEHRWTTHEYRLDDIKSGDRARKAPLLAALRQLIAEHGG